MVEMLNPIYDSSFKFLMSDEKVARILLSTMLKRNVTELSTASQEYVDYINSVRAEGKDYPVYRLDFKATITDTSTDSDGNEVTRDETVLIELQKVWLQTELLRFRKYLGGQYSDPQNVGTDGVTPRHIVAIYLLGHQIPMMTEPIAYGYGNALVDYDGRPIAMSGKSSFVDSLTHDIVIVQIPRLPSKPGNAAERLLNVFDQRFRLASDHCVVSMPDDAAWDGGAGKREIVNKLREGLLDPDMRRKISVEQEILWEMDQRDLQIEQYKAEAEKNKAEAEKNRAEAEKNKEEAEKNRAEAERNMNALRLSAIALHEMGMSPEQIAKAINVSVEDVGGLLG